MAKKLFGIFILFILCASIFCSCDILSTIGINIGTEDEVGDNADTEAPGTDKDDKDETLENGGENEELNGEDESDKKPSNGSDGTESDGEKEPDDPSDSEKPNEENGGNENDKKNCAHVFSEWEIVTAAGCLTAGDEVRYCTLCSQRERKGTLPLGHKSVVDPPVAATCETDGATYGTHCERCGAVTTAPNKIPALGHKEITAPGKEPTCTEAGYGECTSCEVCFKVLVKGEEIPARGHSEITVNASTPTCSKTGYTGDVKCSVCEEILAKGKSIEMTEHTGKFELSSDGNKMVRICPTCGKTESTDIASSTGTETLKYEDRNDGTVWVKGISDSSETTVIIPKKTSSGKTVSGISSDAFKNNKVIEFVYIPDSVTFIGTNSFYYCSALKTVRFPEGELSLNYYSFAFSGIEKVDLSKTVMPTVANQSFYGCEKLKTLTLGNSTTRIDTSAFNGCKKLETVTYTALTEVGEKAFSRCTALKVFRNTKSTKNLDTLVRIESQAFSSSGIKNITFGSCLELLVYDAFQYCTNLGTVDFSNTTRTSISGLAYSKFEKIIFPSGTTEIGQKAFMGAYFGTLTLPDTVRIINESAFKDAVATKITTGRKLTEIKNYAFSGFRGEIDVNASTSLDSIGYRAFAESEIKVFLTPKGIHDIGKEAFYGCNKLEVLAVSFRSTSASASNYAHECLGVLFDERSDLFTQDKYIPASLHTLIVNYDPGSRDFFDIPSIKTVVLNKNNITIGAEAFGWCSNIERVFYKGTAEEWANVTIGPTNGEITDAATYFYSETEPTAEGNFWHYVNGIPTAW